MSKTHEEGSEINKPLIPKTQGQIIRELRDKQKEDRASTVERYVVQIYEKCKRKISDLPIRIRERFIENDLCPIDIEVVIDNYFETYLLSCEIRKGFNAKTYEYEGFKLKMPRIYSGFFNSYAVIQLSID
jgi:hypothetical protein